MKKLRTLLLLLLTAFFVLSIFISCASTAVETEERIDQQQPAATQPEDTSEPVPETEEELTEVIEEEKAEEPPEKQPEPEPEPDAEPSEEVSQEEQAEKPEPEAQPSDDITEAVPEDFYLYILHTNDLHGRVTEGRYDGMGLPVLSTAVNMYRQQAKHVLLLDAGDALHGTPFTNLFEGESMVELMNAIGYDAMSAGNHDFNYGYERLIELNELSDFPILSANTYDADDNRILPSHTSIEINGLSIGVFGLTTTESAYKVHPRYIQDLTFEDSVQSAREMVAQLEDDVDFIIALTHLGVDPESTDTAERLAQEVAGIDVIIDGHSHTALEEGRTVGDTIIAQAGQYGMNLGVVELHVSQGAIQAKRAYLHTKEEAQEREIEPDESVATLIQEWNEQLEEKTSEVVAYTDKTLVGDRDKVRSRPTNLSRLITNAMLEATGADAALTNGGGIRSSIDAGEITRGEILSVLPFNNTCVVIEVTGEELIAAVEHGFKELPEPSGSYSQLGNLIPIYNINKPPGSRLYRLKVNGGNVDPEETYKLATNDFTAAGGDGYDMFAEKPILAEIGTLDEIVADYLREHYPLPE
ncbi:MAG: bifunctional metallophosphatase/5'-nucleotidase [Spirochaetota bacterium]